MCISMITSRTALHESMIVEHSRLSIMIKPDNVTLICFRVLHTMDTVHCVQHQNLSSGNHDPYPVRHEYPGTLQSQYVMIICLIVISH